MRGVLISIAGGPAMGVGNIDEAAHHVIRTVAPEVDVLFAASYDTRLEDRMQIAIIATGIESAVPTWQEPASYQDTRHRCMASDGRLLDVTSLIEDLARKPTLPAIWFEDIRHILDLGRGRASALGRGGGIGPTGAVEAAEAAVADLGRAILCLQHGNWSG